MAGSPSQADPPGTGQEVAYGHRTNPLPRESVARLLAVPLLRALTMFIRRR
jgi:hypothetical protein